VDQGRAISGGIERRYRGPPLCCQSTASFATRGIARSGSSALSGFCNKNDLWAFDEHTLVFRAQSKFPSNELTEVYALQRLRLSRAWVTGSLPCFLLAPSKLC